MFPVNKTLKNIVQATRNNLLCVAGLSYRIVAETLYARALQKVYPWRALRCALPSLTLPATVLFPGLKMGIRVTKQATSLQKHLPSAIPLISSDAFHYAVKNKIILRFLPLRFFKSQERL